MRSQGPACAAWHKRGSGLHFVLSGRPNHLWFFLYWSLPSVMTLRYCDAQKMAVLDGGAASHMHLSESRLLIILLMFEVDDLSVAWVMEDIALMHVETRRSPLRYEPRQYSRWIANSCRISIEARMVHTLTFNSACVSGNISCTSRIRMHFGAAVRFGGVCWNDFDVWEPWLFISRM